MKHVLATLLLALAGCTSAFAQLQPPPEEPAPYVDLTEHVLDATVALTTIDGRPFCSGVMWRDKVLTAAHCVDEPAEPVYVAFREDHDNDTRWFTRVYSFLPLYHDEVQDFAMLGAMELVHSKYDNLELYDGSPRTGQALVVIGHPSGLTYTVTDGIVSYPKRTLREGQVWMQMSAPIWFGNSGGPVLTRHGEIIGISSFIWDLQNHLGGACHIDVIRRAALQDQQH